MWKSQVRAKRLKNEGAWRVADAGDPLLGRQPHMETTSQPPRTPRSLRCPGFQFFSSPSVGGACCRASSLLFVAL